MKHEHEVESPYRSERMNETCPIHHSPQVTDYSGGRSFECGCVLIYDDGPSARAAQLASLQAENERLRKAARAVWESQCDAVNIDGSVCVDWELLDQLAALALNDKEPSDDRG